MAVLVAGWGVEGTAVVVADGDREGVQFAGEQRGTAGAQGGGPGGRVAARAAGAVGGLVVCAPRAVMAQP